jgi:hypothetical protein
MLFTNTGYFHSRAPIATIYARFSIHDSLAKLLDAPRDFRAATSPT